MTCPELAVDVLILGAGPAGAATALGLLAAGVKRVLLVDRPITRPFQIGESATPDVPALLEQLGLEKDLGKLGHRAYHGNLSLWGGASIVDHFLFRGRGHGWHLNRQAFNIWLQDQAVARGAKLVSPASLAGILPRPDGWQMNITGLGKITAHVVVDATGRKAALASHLGAHWQKLDALVALAVRVAPVDGFAGLSLVEPFADGWWYAASLPGEHTIVTLMTDRDIARERGFYDAQGYLNAWRSASELPARVQPPAEPGQIAVFAAHGGFLNRAAGSRWIAVGDALIAFDPLTSSGIAGALDDALAAIPAILSQLTGNTEASRVYAQRANNTLKRYLTEHQQHYSTERRWSDQPFWARRAMNKMQVYKQNA